MLAEHWSDSGYRVAVVTQAPVSDDFFTLSDRATRVVAGGVGSVGGVIGRVPRNIWRLLLLRRALKRADAPLVFVFVGRTIIQTLLANTGLPYKIVACERNDPSTQSLGRQWDLLRRIIYPRAALVTANSRSAVEYMTAFVPRSRLRLVRNPVSLAEACDEAERERAFVVSGRLVSQKGHDTILRAFAQITSQVENWRIWILGRGELEKPLRALCRELGIEGRVDWFGLVPDPETYYARASVFICASLYEGMPNAMLEAMSARLPVILSDSCSGALELVEHGRTGLVFRQGCVASLAGAMLALATDSDQRRGLGDAGRTAVEAFSPERVFAAWDEIGEEVLRDS